MTGIIDYGAGNLLSVANAVKFLGFDSLRVRSARCDSDNIVIIVGHLTKAIEPISCEDAVELKVLLGPVGPVFVMIGFVGEPE